MLLYNRNRDYTIVIITGEFILYIGQALVALAIIAAPVASDICKITWYQPEEPEGLKEFANHTKNLKTF